jgi:hypothetical protein
METDANIAIRTTIEEQPELMQFVDVQEGRSAYCHYSFFQGTIRLFPAARVLVRHSPHSEAVAEIIHPEGDAPIAVPVPLEDIRVEAIAKPNDHLWLTIQNVVVGSSTTQKISLKRDGLQASSVEEAFAGALVDHNLVTDALPMTQDSLLSESAGRIWVTNYGPTVRPASELAPFIGPMYY